LKPQKQNLAVQGWITLISVILLVLKFTAYYLTHSVSILTDALESIVNVAAGFIGLYSLYIAAKPRDKNHPYGHGKAEFISAAVEGTLISSAGAIIIYKAIKSFIVPVPLQQLDYGIMLVAAAALVNYIMGAVSIYRGKKNNSLALLASGRHLQSDSYTTLGILVGLGLIYFTGQQWIDPAVAILFGSFIIFTGYRILRKSIAGIMDEADRKILNNMAEILNKNRRENWVDLHNLRVIKYGSLLHLDCHLTLPWFLNVHEAHREVDALAELVRMNFGESVELFVHTDGCLEYSCMICNRKNCPERKHEFKRQIKWTIDTILQNQKHRL